MTGDFDDVAQKELRLAISEVITASGDPALGNRTTHDAAREWIACGFDDAEEVSEWLAARCFDARVAAVLEEAGFTPAQAALRTEAGNADYEDTIGYKIARGDLSLDEARRIITRAFWHE